MCCYFESTKQVSVGKIRQATLWTIKLLNKAFSLCTFCLLSACSAECVSCFQLVRKIPSLAYCTYKVKCGLQHARESNPQTLVPADTQPIIAELACLSRCKIPELRLERSSPLQNTNTSQNKNLCTLSCAVKLLKLCEAPRGTPFLLKTKMWRAAERKTVSDLSRQAGKCQ